MNEILQISATILLSLGGAGAIILACSTWLGKVWANRIMEKEKAQYILELENIKNTLQGQREKGLYIHRVQFEKEFEIYQEIWQSLVPAYEDVIALRPMLDRIDPQQSEEERISTRLDAFAKSFEPFRKIVHKHKPFYAPDVFSTLQKLITLFYHEALEYKQKDIKKPVEYWTSQKEYRDKIEKAIDECCEAIRIRIDSSKIIKE